MPDAPDHVIRPAVADDVPWIYSSWIKSYREAGEAIQKDPKVVSTRQIRYGRIPYRSFRTGYRAIMERVTGREGVVTIVACNPECREQVRGWICGSVTPDGAVLHYAHVKSEWRQQGIAKALVAALGVTPEMKVEYTNHTMLSWLLNSRLLTLPLEDVVPESWIYNPYLFA